MDREAAARCAESRGFPVDLPPALPLHLGSGAQRLQDGRRAVLRNGFDPRLIQDMEGLGLVSMRERVHHFDGEIAIDSRPSSGTRISVRLPVGAVDQAEGL